MQQNLAAILRSRFAKRFGSEPDVMAYAPGRVEVLGNHTDYNEGFVLSAAINHGLCFACARADTNTATLYGTKVDENYTFDATAPVRSTTLTWPNYIIGVYAGILERLEAGGGFNAAIRGDVPLGAGLSSSAALEMSTGLGLCRLFDLELDPLDLARIGQRAENEYAGAMTGLLDHISSLYGRADALVMTDFRSLAVEEVPLGHDVCLLTCNSNTSHSLVDGEYNERRASCEAAAAYFAAALGRPVGALRDVTPADLETHRDRMPAIPAQRAAHVIGENDRVLRGAQLLKAGDLEGFGALMYASHESSRMNFENSCPELDFLVEQCRGIPGVLGARLSGGGFGGSIVALVHPDEAEAIGRALAAAYRNEYGHDADARVITPSAGARVIWPE